MKGLFFQNWKSLKDVWRKLMYILSDPQKRLARLVFLLTVIGAVFDTLGVSVIVPLVQSFIAADALMNNSYLQPLICFFHITTPATLIVMICVFVIIIYILKNIYLIFLSYMRVKYASKVRRELSVKMMYSYMRRGYEFFLDVNTADLLRGTGYDVNAVYDVINQIFRMLAEVLTVICICAFMFYKDPAITTGLMFFLLFSVGSLIMGFQKRLKSSGDVYRKCTVKTNKYLQESFQGIKDVLVFRRELFFAKKYEEAYSEQQKADIVRVVSSESPAYIIEAICVSGFILLISLKFLFGSMNDDFIPNLAAFAVAAFRILPSIGRISSSYNQLVYIGVALNATYNNLKEVEEYEKNARALNASGMNDKLPFCGKIEIRDLDWCYPRSEKKILDHCCLSIKKGTSIAFIGQSGAGKSTLADILLGLLIPQKGIIEVDGKDIYKNMNAWKANIGYVPQNVFLRDDTIRNNIAFGLDESEIDEKKVWNAIEQAQLRKTIEELPEGLDTLMGERGVRFSGGQRQRVAIARALYNNPDIMILDEATAALDNDTETAVMEAIDALHGNKTLIIVAHRLTTIRNCDAIYEIKGGKAILRNKQDIFLEFK